VGKSRPKSPGRTLTIEFKKTNSCKLGRGPLWNEGPCNFNQASLIRRLEERCPRLVGQTATLEEFQPEKISAGSRRISSNQSRLKDSAQTLKACCKLKPGTIAGGSSPVKFRTPKLHVFAPGGET